MKLLASDTMQTLTWLSGSDLNQVQRAVVDNINRLKKEGYTEFEVEFNTQNFFITEDRPAEVKAVFNTPSNVSVNVVEKNNVLTFHHFAYITARLPAPVKKVSWWKP